MTRRSIVPPGPDCALCGHEAGVDTEEVFAAGYVAGRHAVGHGEKAKERFCARHARVLDDAVAEYVRHGILVR